MYTIPENFDNASLIGETIFAISFGLNLITLSFNKGFIQFSGRFSFVHSGQKNEYEEVYPLKSDLGLLGLLEKSIIEVQVESNRKVLILTFEDKSVLKLIGDDAFESYTLKVDDLVIIV